MRPGRRSLAGRLLAGVALVQLLLAAGLVWVAIVHARRELLASFDTGLHGQLMSIAALVRYPEHGATPLVFDPSLIPADLTRERGFYQVRGPNGDSVNSTIPFGVTTPPDPPDGTVFWNFEYQGAPYRGLRMTHLPILDTEEDIPGPPALLDVTYAAPTTTLRREVVQEGEAVGGASLLLLGLSLAAATWAIRRALQPLHSLAQQAAAISPRNWEFEAPAAGADTLELAPLIHALELMLQRLQQSFTRQREFLADAAHELKTPTTILKSTWQTLLQRPRPEEEYQEAARSSLQDIERLEQRLQRMLQLARLEQSSAEASRVAPSIELGATCETALLRVRPLAQVRGIELRGRSLDSRRTLQAEAEDLELVWVNLLENAIQHSHEGSVVEIALGESEEAWARVEVSDHGSGIGASEMPYIFDRFRRGDGDRERPGIGLGLAIARAIVEAYGGTISAESTPGQGTRMTVRLPVDA